MAELEKLLAQRLAWARSQRAQKGKREDGPRALTLQKRYDYANGRQLDDQLTYYRGIQPRDEEKREFLKVARTGDKIGPGLNRFVAGVLGLDPEWSIKRVDSDVTSELLEGDTEPDRADTEADAPTPEQLASAQELNDLEDTMTVWHREARLHATLKDAYRYSLWGAESELRQYIPDIYAEDERVKNRTFRTVDEALSVIYFQAIDPRYAGPVKDEHGNTLAHWYEYEEESDGKLSKPSVYVELHTPEQVLVYEDGLEGLKLVPDRVYVNPFYQPEERPDFLMHTLEHQSGGVLDESIIDEQDSLNESKVEMRRNGQMGGHRQLIVINAQGAEDEKGEAVPYQFGPSVVAHINGFSYDTGDGKKAITTPSVVIVPPVDPDNFIKAIKHHSFEILARWSQTHLEADFLAISGESKKDSRASWEENLELEAAPPSDALAWAIRNALRFAYWLTGADDNKYDAYEVIPSLKLAVSSADMATVMDGSTLVERGQMSLEALVDVNPMVASKEAEKAQLRKEAKERAARAPDVTPTPEPSPPTEVS